jgi:hypothetical protein
MLKLDNNLLDELGLGSLPDDQKRSMLQHIYETLELRVGTNLANQMTDQQLEEFEKFIDEGGDANQAQALQWLETNLPNYKQVVNDVFEALKGEVKQMAPQLLAASQQQPAMAPPVQPQSTPAAPTAPPAPPAAYQQQPVQPQQPVPVQPQAPQTTPYESLPGQPAPPPPQPQQPSQYPPQQPPAGPGASQSPQQYPQSTL